MNYSKLQKIISFYIIFVLLFSITFRIPFLSSLSKTSAAGENFNNLVSIIVTKEIYDDLSSEIGRYASDIQGVLENTRAIILPVPDDVTPFEISSLNEALYFEGYKSLEPNAPFESRLIGTVLIGNIPLAILEDNGKTTKSIFPYTDFEDKGYIYNRDTGTYKKNEDNYKELKAEIWHGVISSNSSSDTVTEQLGAYFDKNHEFYVGEGVFQTQTGVINGVLDDEVSSDYEPFVFYFDQIREEKSIHYPAYKAYEAYRDNKEDIVYHRYSKTLAEKIKKQVLGAEQDSIKELFDKVSDERIVDLLDRQNDDGLGNASDISTRSVVQKTTKKFVEIFNGGQIEELRTNVHNAGRYNKDGSKVNVDFIPYLVSILDIVSDELIKATNTDLENQIDELVKEGLSRKIPLAASIEKTRLEFDSSNLVQIITGEPQVTASEKYINFLHGRDASTITEAEQCTIYRGNTTNSGTLVESNRGINIKNIQPDLELCASEGNSNNIGDITRGLWGGNSPINLDMEGAENGDIRLGNHDLTYSITPLFDILGSKKVEDSSKNPSPLNCMDNNFIVAIGEYGGLDDGADDGLDVGYKIPETTGSVEGIGPNWPNTFLNRNINWCRVVNHKLSEDPNSNVEPADFYSLYNSTNNYGGCGKRVEIDGTVVVTQDLSIFNGVDDAECEYYTYKFNTIPSYMFHKSPTVEELREEIKNPVTPNLAVDRDRYVDFIGAGGEYAKINYPYLFRVGQNSSIASIADAKRVLGNYLSQKNAEINSLISSNTPRSGDDIYNDYLKTGVYPSANFDLLSYLQNKPFREIDGKQISYYDFLAFAIYWNSLSSTSAKYSFILENYLSDQFGGNDFNFILPKNKKLYEIAYLGAPGDTQNMYIKLDPESKGENPYGDTVGENSILDSNLIGIKTISNSIQADGLFKCAPPEGVPIWEWVPAVVCWIKNMLPPKISISAGGCGPNLEDYDSYKDELIQKNILGESSLTGSLSCSRNTKDGLDIGNNIIPAGGDIYIYDEKDNLENIEQNGLFIGIPTENLDFPITISMLDSSGDTILTRANIASFSGINKIISGQIKDSGTYKLILEDSDGNKFSKDFEVVSGKPSSFLIKLGTTVLEKGGISTNIVTILDEYGNPAVGGPYELSLEIVGAGATFDDGSMEKDYNIVDGFTAFRTKALNNGSFRIRARLNNISKISQEIKIVDNITLNITNEPTEGFKVGKKTYKLNIELQSSNGQKLSSLNSRIYFKIPKKYGRVTKPYFDVASGEAKIEFETAYLAGEDIPIEFQFEGQKNLYKTNITINPLDPMKIDLKTTKSKLMVGGNTNIKAELKDVYGNIVFTDNNTELELEILDKYRNIISANTTTKTASNGKASFGVNIGDTPGIAYAKVSASSIESNTFTISGESPDGEDYTIDAASENAIKLEVFYKWSAEKIVGKKYNALYTTMLGASYGDFTKKDYLASGILFDRNNRGLAVTSLLNNPYNYSDIVQISQNGSVSKVYNSSDLSQDIELNLEFDSNGIPYLDLYNNSLTTYIGKIYYNFGDNLELKNCSNSECNKDFDKTTIYLEGLNLNYSIEEDSGVLRILSSSQDEIFSVSSSGKITKASYLELKPINSNSKSAIFELKNANTTIAKLAFYFKDSSIKYARNSSQLRGLLATAKNSIIISLETDSYAVRDVISTQGQSVKSIYYLDPFAKSFSLDSFSRENPDSYENFISEEGLGWKGANKSLLEFASGKSVGEAVMDYASVGVINLGDPVVFLKKKKLKLPQTGTDRNFDRTIGKKLNKESIVNYSVFDYNNDDKDDILLIGTDGVFRLLENKNIAGNFLNQGELAKVSDLGNPELVLAGDFRGDGYDDIFFVNKNGDAFIFNNEDKIFSREELNLGLGARVIQSRVFDMDNDGSDDVVTLDDAGKITIFYGGESFPNYKLEVSKDMGISLDSEPRDDLGVVYFDGLYQLSEDGDSSALLEENYYDKLLSMMPQPTKEELEKFQEAEKNKINDDVVDSYVFVKLAYNPEPDNQVDQTNTGQTVDDLLNNLPKNFSSDLDGKLNNLGNDLENLQNLYGNSSSGQINIVGGNPTKTTTFIRSQYSSLVGLSVQKIYNDENGGTLKAGDIVEVKLTLTNTGATTLENIAYLEGIPKIFDIDEESITINNQDIEIKSGIDDYEFLIEHFDLFSGESVNITYSLTTKPIKYGFIEVGLFEKEELGDDNYGDIIFKMDEKNCSDTVKIFRSVNPRSYEQGEKEPICDGTKLELPLDMQDSDGNGVPDYIDELANISNPPTDEDIEKLENYKSDVEEDIYKDSDGDGIPDIEDDSPNYSGDDILGALDDLNVDIDKISEGMDTIIQGLGCGFGGGSCIASPFNWAPLAPGNDPTFLGFPIGDGLHVNEGLPFFSALTWTPSPTGCIPTTWPPSPLGPGCSVPGAGGRLGSWSPSNFARLYYTPTITGAHGFAACYGAPAITSGNIPPIGLSPIVPGGNCIVAAYPMNYCSDNEVKGDPTSIGTPQSFGSYGVINGNCSGKKSRKSLPETNKIDTSFVDDYLAYKRTGRAGENLINSFKDVFSNPAGPGARNDSSGFNAEPLVSLDGGNDGLGELSVDLDVSAIKAGNWSDVIKVKNTRIFAFPEFLMDWVTRQIEEIITKLTDFPTVFVILPDFGGLFNGDWGEYISNGLEGAYRKGKDKQEQKDKKIDVKIGDLKNEKNGKDCDGEDRLSCMNIDLQIADLNRQKGFGFTKQYSGIKQAYEFLSSVPFVSIEPEIVELNIPWIDKASLDKTILDYKNTLASRKQEVASAGESWSFGASCNPGDTQCENENALKNKLNLNLSNTIKSLEKNISILEEYKNFPEKLSSLVNKKQEWLDQILCNVETISYITGGRIGKNGERFKAWVELYVLIKAILKSWQLLADIFIDYDASCHDCKNERYDLVGFIMKLISMIIPKIPVIQFPKWPDVVIDLHNIRANLNIRIPEFELNLRPIVLPTLPDLNLPRVPNVTVSLPSIPELPRLEIPELPDIPTLPKIELPDLPPPPTLPKLFSSLEGILNILKLVTKAMCILKKSPFVPEWRAGDQIAFLTERSGFLDFDFLNVSLPQFSFPFVDAIEVTTYVNLEFDVEFLVEMARATAIPLNNFTSNTVNMFDVQSQDFRIGEEIPSDFEFSPLGMKIENGKVKTNLKEFIKFISIGITKLSSQIKAQSLETLSNTEFKKRINMQLASIANSGDPNIFKLKKVWDDVNTMNYSKENKLIEKLQKLNSQKFDTLKSIIELEKQKTKKLKNQIKSLNNPEFIKKVSFDTKQDFKAYNSSLGKYNEAFKNTARNLIVGENKQAKELKPMGELVLNTIKKAYPSPKTSQPKLLASLPNPGSSGQLNSCQRANSKDFKYEYKGLYVVEDDTSYVLFDYQDELNGKEKLIAIDLEVDGDEDLLYEMGGNLYVKENLENTDNKIYIDSVLTVKIGDNKFVNGGDFIESVNNFGEISVTSKNINISFSASNKSGVNAYRIEYYKKVDAYLDSNSTQKFVIDAFVDNSSKLLEQAQNDYIIQNNFVQIKSYGDNLSGIELYTKELKSIKDDLKDDKAVVVSSLTPIYTGNDSASIEYIDKSGEIQRLNLRKNSYTQFKQNTKIVSVDGNVYIETGEDDTIRGQDILSYKKPLALGSYISKNGDSADERSYIELSYGNGSDSNLDFNNVAGYRVYDLGYKDDSYLISINIPNGYYYARIYAIGDNGTLGTASKQILLSPQLEADRIAPEINFSSNTIKIPIGKYKTINFGNYIYDDSGLENINLEVSGIPEDNYEILNNLRIKFKNFEETENIDITLIVIDSNGNATSQNLTIEVYASIPEINSYSGGVIKGAVGEKISGLDISLYRIRGKTIDRLEDINSGTTVSTDADGKFSFNIDNSGSGVYIKNGDNTIANIDENTGIIKELNPGYSISVSVSQNFLDSPEIIISDSSKKEIYRSKILTNNKKDINILDNFNSIGEDNGLYFQLEDPSFDFYKISSTARYNPGAIVLYRKADTKKIPLFVISKDGRIKTLNEFYSLEYDSRNGYIMLNLIDRHFEKTVGRLLYKIDNNFLIK